MGEKALCLLIGYLFGCILTAELIVKHKTGKSVSEFGTGNPGMANVMRIFGFKTGAAVLAGDLIKTVAAVLICCLLFGRSSVLPSGKPLGQPAVLWAGLGATLGHNWPVWRRLKGGKGVAVAFGGLLGVNWKIALLCLLTVVVFTLISKRMSVGSIAGAASAIIYALIFEKSFLIYIIIMAGTIIYMHRGNIKRLINHEEPTLSFLDKKKGSKG